MAEPRRRPSIASQTFFQKGDVTEKYTIGDVLGTGNYAEVRLGVSRETGEKVAIKVIQLTKETTADILNEIDILARVDDHPHVIQLKAIYEKKGKMYIVMELVTGGELFDRIIARQHFSENDARDVMHVLISTIKHMHTHGIVHRDLKPENILFATPAPDSPIKIADFGLAKLYQPNEDGDNLKTLCGTPGYVAPEVLKNRNGYSPQCDMWSLGVILYILLCGYPPFQHEQQSKLFKQILKADYQFHSPWWDKVSDDAKDMVSKLLVVDSEKRLAPADALRHPWMVNTAPGSSVDIKTLEDYVRKLHKRKFRMIKNSIVMAKRMGELYLGPTGDDEAAASAP
jgi:calcium/calmodulin-dependent protein kinase I